ncbi:MAG: GNAT family N-acetyltransferase [Lachnospiraceae bacterium]|nr:GNAT family N-acetyltransferase [Lachnospiraceae bacterium]
MDRDERNRLICKQLSADYCFDPDEFKSGSGHVFSLYEPLAGRRVFDPHEDVFLKVVSYKNRLLFTGKKEIITECEKRYKDVDAAWFMEPKPLRSLNDLLYGYGYRIEKMHPFYTSFEPREVKADAYEIRYFETEEIEQFRGDDRFEKAYSFLEAAPDVVGVGAYKDGKILGMAGASADSPLFWQIGIDVVPEARGQGIGVILVSLLRNEILKRGRVPYYGTAVSHTLSQNIAIRSGFTVAFTELITSKVSE